MAFKRDNVNETDLSVLFYIVNYKAESGGDAPSYRQIAKNVDGASSTGHIGMIIKKLKRLGHVEHRSGERGIRVVGARWFTPTEYEALRQFATQIASGDKDAIGPMVKLVMR
jgi:hypothetical protein